MSCRQGLRVEESSSGNSATLREYRREIGKLCGKDVVANAATKERYFTDWDWLRAARSLSNHCCIFYLCPCTKKDYKEIEMQKKIIKCRFQWLKIASLQSKCPSYLHSFLIRTNSWTRWKLSTFKAYPLFQNSLSNYGLACLGKGERGEQHNRATLFNLSSRAQAAGPWKPTP